ncbi:MAG: SH3 domain-containing protein [Bacteroidia bacterium]|nr:SH3 domain-containing protein [Bacteroidia bacterium]
MKKLFVLFVTLLSLFTNVIGQEKYKVTSATLNIRDCPKKECNKVFELSYGDEVELIEKTTDDWYLINYYGKQGYVSSEFLSKSTPIIENDNDLQKDSYNKNTISLIIIVGITLIAIILGFISSSKTFHVISFTLLFVIIGLVVGFFIFGKVPFVNEYISLKFLNPLSNSADDDALFKIFSYAILEPIIQKIYISGAVGGIVGLIVGLLQKNKTKNE